jgi:hypothetical protein
MRQPNYKYLNNLFIFYNIYKNIYTYIPIQLRGHRDATEIFILSFCYIKKTLNIFKKCKE